jgi:hypothetical protein
MDGKDLAHWGLLPKVLPGLLIVGNFSWDIHRTPPPKKSKHQNSYLTPCCGLEVQNPTQALKSVKSPGNTFDLSPKWARTLPSVGKFHGICIEPPQIVFQISMMIFDTLLWV